MRYAPSQSEASYACEGQDKHASLFCHNFKWQKRFFYKAGTWLTPAVPAASGAQLLADLAAAVAVAVVAAAAVVVVEAAAVVAAEACSTLWPFRASLFYECLVISAANVIKLFTPVIYERAK